MTTSDRFWAPEMAVEAFEDAIGPEVTSWLRQEALTLSLGQVTCPDFLEHDVAGLPCPLCGAAL